MKKPNPKPSGKYKLYYILWMDHAGHKENGWRDFDVMREFNVFPVHSVGWVIDENEHRLSVCPHFNESEEVGAGQLYIIKKAILYKQEIKL